MRNCGGCGNPGGSTKRIFGRKFNNVCVTSMRTTNPSAEELEWMKKIVEIRKKDIMSENNLEQSATSYDRHVVKSITGCDWILLAF